MLKDCTAYHILFFVLILMLGLGCKSQEQVVTVAETQSQMVKYEEPEDLMEKKQEAPLFEKTIASIKNEVDVEIELGVIVPVPKDMAGGYTHERHKRNWFILQKAGSLYKYTGDEKYANYIKEQFMAYAELFPTLPLHPTNRSYATGKIFWQCLNDSNWLVYSSQAYANIYDRLTEQERDHLESNLFRPLADFLSVENPQFFNRVHNHSTWANAAVGMIGLVMKDQELIDRALYGLQDDDLDESMVDNDGGYIVAEGVRKAGFLAQLDHSFSPDGHFTEGPYYLRYAMTPFLLFAKELDKTMPELDIYSYRDNILQKAVYSLLYETDAQGRFFPINDAQKGMSWLSREVVAAVNIAYKNFGKDPMLLSIAEKQGKVIIDDAGFQVARDIALGLSKPFKHKSISYRDGAEGKSGGVTVMRSSSQGESELCVLFKYAAQGMGHGHFDRLSYSIYDNEDEVVQDYASARWVNIDQKGGGRYLKENNTFAKQTVAHNALVVNEQSQYEGSVKVGEKNNPILYYDNFENANLQIVSAKDITAYPGTEMHRTLIMLNDENMAEPVLLDILKVRSETKQNYDLPLWYQGQILSTSFSYEANSNQLNTLGTDHGYQHLWQEASATIDSSATQMTWFRDGKFFTITSRADHGDKIILARSGANDPEFNLRRDPVMIHRKNDVTDALFVSLIEPHGVYSSVTETPLSPFPSITSVEVLYDDRNYTAIKYNDSKTSHIILLCNSNALEASRHSLDIKDEPYSWDGPYKLISRNHKED